MQKKIGVAIVGGGYGSRVLLPVCLEHPLLDVRWMVTESQPVSGLPESVRWSSNLNNFLSDAQVGLVLIATPHHLHAAHALKALEAKKHILVQKPLALDLVAAQNIVDYAFTCHLVAAIDYSFNFVPARLLIRDIIKAGEIGNVQSIRFAFYRDDFDQWPSQWYKDSSKGGGALFATGMHQIAAARFILEDSFLWVDSVMVFEEGIDVGFQILSQSRSGSIINLETSHRVAGVGGHIIEVFGEHGSLQLDKLGNVLLSRSGAVTKLSPNEIHCTGFGNNPWKGNYRHQPTARVIDMVVRQIKVKNRDFPINLQNGVEDLKVAMSIRKSFCEKRRTTI